MEIFPVWICLGDGGCAGGGYDRRHRHFVCTHARARGLLVRLGGPDDYRNETHDSHSKFAAGPEVPATVAVSLARFPTTRLPDLYSGHLHGLDGVHHGE